MRFTGEDVRAYRDEHQCGVFEAKAALRKIEIDTRLHSLMRHAKGEMRELIDIVREMNR